MVNIKGEHSFGLERLESPKKRTALFGDIVWNRSFGWQQLESQLGWFSNMCGQIDQKMIVHPLLWHVSFATKWWFPSLVTFWRSNFPGIWPTKTPNFVGWNWWNLVLALGFPFPSQVLYRMGILAALRSKVRTFQQRLGVGIRDSTGGLVLLKPTSRMVPVMVIQRGW